MLAAVLATMQATSRSGSMRSRRSVDGILALKGVIEVVERRSARKSASAAEAAAIARLSSRRLTSLAEMRRREGDALGADACARLDEIAALAARAEAAPGRKPEAIKARLAEQIAALLETSDRFDPDRLHQEALLIASKADIREELDRLAAHVAQARELLGEGGPVGRKLDFLSQELNREVNTLCSKSNDIELTNIGLEMKNRGRAVPRAGAESGVRRWRRAARARRGGAARADVRAVLALGRRQDHAVAPCCWTREPDIRCRSR